MCNIFLHVTSQIWSQRSQSNVCFSSPDQSHLSYFFATNKIGSYKYCEYNNVGNG